MVLKFNGQLIDIMGEDARATNWEDVTGLSATDIRQHMEKDNGFTLVRVIDNEKASKYINNKKVDILTLEEANTVIDTIPSKYKIYNENLMATNLNSKVSKGVIDLDEMLPDWTDQQEAEFLYNKGISGIKKIPRPPYFIEE